MEQSKKVTIRPTGTSLSGVTNAGNGKVKVTWLRNKSATGYRIQYSTDSKFKKNVTTVNISKNQTTKVTLSKLKKERHTMFGSQLIRMSETKFTLHGAK